MVSHHDIQIGDKVLVNWRDHLVDKFLSNKRYKYIVSPVWQHIANEDPTLLVCFLGKKRILCEYSNGWDEHRDWFLPKNLHKAKD